MKERMNGHRFFYCLYFKFYYINIDGKVHILNVQLDDFTHRDTHTHIY